MPKMLADENRKLVALTTKPVDVLAPTVTELAAGIELQTLVTAADFAWGATGEDTTTDPPLAGGALNVSTPGRKTVEIGMNFFRWTDDTEDTAWSTFTESGLTFYLYLRKGKDHTTAWAADDAPEYAEVVTGSPLGQNPDGGVGYEKFRVNFYPQAFDDHGVTVAAGA